MGNNFYKIKAEIILNENRRTPIKNGYRPAFLCNGNLMTGHIIILGSSSLKPGESGIAEISFISNEFLKETRIGDVIPFYEGPVVNIGYIVIKEIYENS